MASIAHKSTFKATSEHRTLSLTVQHFLYPGSDDIRSQVVSSQNPLIFTLSGSRDGISATNDELLDSQTTNYLLQFLRKHALELGLHAISDIVRSNDNNASFSVTFMHPKPPEEEAGFEQTTLRCLHLDYKWKTYRKAAKEVNNHQSDICDEPFSSKLTLPLQALLEDVVIRFVKLSLVKRYPFIFGSWARQFSNESLYFRSMITSINNMLKRSFNVTFRSRCEHLLKLLRTRDITRNSSHGGETNSHDRLSLPIESAFYLAMQSIFKAGLRPRSFTSVRTYRTDLEEEDILPSSSDSMVQPLSLNARSYRNSELFLDYEFQPEGLSFTGPSTPGPFFLDTSHAIDADHELLAFDTDEDTEIGLIDTEGHINPGFDLDLSEFDDDQDCSQDSAQASEIYNGDSLMDPDSSFPRIKRLSFAVDIGHYGHNSYGGRYHPRTRDGATGVEEGSYQANTHFASATRERIQSGDFKISQARNDADHMVCLTENGLRDSLQSDTSLLHGEAIESPNFGSPSTSEEDLDFFAPTPEEPGRSTMDVGTVLLSMSNSRSHTLQDEIFDIWSEFPVLDESMKKLETRRNRGKFSCPTNSVNDNKAMITQSDAWPTAFCSRVSVSDVLDDDFILENDIDGSGFLVDDILPHGPGDDVGFIGNGGEDWMEDEMEFPFAD